MSTCSCGASSSPSGRTPARILLLPASPSIWLRAASSAAWPLLPRSWSRNEKPVAVPSSGIAGGTSAKMNASRTFDSAPNARPAMPGAECSGPSRSSHGFRVTNASAAFWPLPEKLKPSTLTICETSGWFRKKPSACCITDERAALRRTRGQLDVGDQVALVLGRQERRRHAQEHEHREADDQPEQDQEAPGAAQDLRDPVLVAVRRRLEAAVEPAEEAALLVLVAGLDRLQEGRAERRRQRQREKHREQHRADHHQRELAIDVADRAGEERHRQEHRDQGHA